MTKKYENHIEYCYKQLLGLLHASNCLEQKKSHPNDICDHKDCSKFQELKVHIDSCQNGEKCDKKRCFFAKALVFHYSNCAQSKNNQKSTCKICKHICNKSMKKYQIEQPPANESIINEIRSKLKRILHAKKCLEANGISCDEDDCEKYVNILEDIITFNGNSDANYKQEHINVINILGHKTDCEDSECIICSEFKPSTAIITNNQPIAGPSNYRSVNQNTREINQNDVNQLQSVNNNRTESDGVAVPLKTFFSNFTEMQSVVDLVKRNTDNTQYPQEMEINSELVVGVEQINIQGYTTTELFEAIENYEDNGQYTPYINNNNIGYVNEQQSYMNIEDTSSNVHNSESISAPPELNQRNILISQSYSEPYSNRQLQDNNLQFQSSCAVENTPNTDFNQNNIQFEEFLVSSVSITNDNSQVQSSYLVENTPDINNGPYTSTVSSYEPSTCIDFNQKQFIISSNIQHEVNPVLITKDNSQVQSSYLVENTPDINNGPYTSTVSCYEPSTCTDFNQKSFTISSNIQHEVNPVLITKVNSQVQSSCTVENIPKITEATSNELKEALKSTLKKLEQEPFGTPVNLNKLNSFEVVITKMGIIKDDIKSGKYSDPWEYINDVWLMFENIWSKNHKNTKLYRYCTKLSKVFDDEINPVMQTLGYCCGHKYKYTLQVLYCSVKLCMNMIPKEATYYSLDDKSLIVCVKCYKKSKDSKICINSTVPSECSVEKDQFKKTNNDNLELEPFVICNECERKQHQICVLYSQNICTGDFVCDTCMKKNGTIRKENKFSAKRLPTTELSIYIETRVQNFLKKKEAGGDKVHIRVVSSSDKILKVKPKMRRRFVENNKLSGEFPYRTKVLLAFQEVDGVDVCFFGMHVQEYGSECPAPNTRRVYIAYLDSVHLFEPKECRTPVYHEILLGYMDYVKQLGFTMAHIWACPPSEGDDYIFHCHPPDQKIPTPKILQEWYKKMLDKGIIERTIQDYKDILKQAMEDKLNSAAELPYFEGDFWPNVLEESIKELDQEEEEKRKQDEIADEPEKRTLLATMKKHKEVFFVIRLHSAQSAASLALAPIQDPDPLMNCDLMDGRDAFLTMSRDKHYEFSSLRRAQFSTLNMLYELHNQGQDKFVYTCNNCKTAVETRYHCTVCDDFDLCLVCKDKVGHPHKMEKLGFDLDDGSSKANPQEARKQFLKCGIPLLEHACQCLRNANCISLYCKRMKSNIAHAKVCCIKAINGCSDCKRVIALCRGHAEECNVERCNVLYCKQIKFKLRNKYRNQDQHFAHRRNTTTNLTK